MDKRILSRYDALRQVVTILEKHKEKLQAIPKLAEACKNLQEHMLTTEELITQKGNIPKITSGNKLLARKELATVAHKLSSILKAYAYDTRNVNITESLITASSLLHDKIAHMRLFTYSKGILELATERQEALKEYGLSQALLQEMDKRCNEFEAVLIEPRTLISERKNTNMLIKIEIDKMYEMVHNQIDPLMELLSDDQELYLKYKSSRTIVDPSYRKREDLHPKEERET